MAATVVVARWGLLLPFTRFNCRKKSTDCSSPFCINAVPIIRSRPSKIRLGTPLSRATDRSSAKISNEFDGYVPDAEFYKVEAIVRPWRVTKISAGLLEIGIRGVTVSDVRGFGAQGVSIERQAGSEFSEDNFVAKVKMEIVVNKTQVESVIEMIIQEARTGEIGDGKIFLIPVADVIRIRTGERGEKAEKMMGGRADMLRTSSA